MGNSLMAYSAPAPDDLTSIHIMLTDLNGVARGKRIPGGQVGKALDGGIRMPFSASAVDIWGRDVEGNALIFEKGDGDGICRPIRDEVMAAPWLGSQAGLVPVWMFDETGAPSPFDPRQALARVLERFHARDLTPVVATELEFYLTPLSPDDRRFSVEGVLSLQQLNTVTPLLDDIYAACAANDIPADAAISECGRGQFEVNLLHRNDALLAADDAILFKTIVKGFAQKHGFAANFMAKPHGDAAGSGLHVHFSLLDASGQNVFDDGTDEGSGVLKHAVAGLLEAMPQTALIFAPHFNSYRRLSPDSHAPTAISWGYENRTAAVRIPGGPHAARRIEHRVAGADANPYLVLAAVLGAALIGIENGDAPPHPVDGNSYVSDAQQLPTDWTAAVAAFAAGKLTRQILPDALCDLLVLAKRQEIARFLQDVTPFEHLTYAEHI